MSNGPSSRSLHHGRCGAAGSGSPGTGERRNAQPSTLATGGQDDREDREDPQQAEPRRQELAAQASAGAEHEGDQRASRAPSSIVQRTVCPDRPVAENASRYASAPSSNARYCSRTSGSTVEVAEREDERERAGRASRPAQSQRGQSCRPRTGSARRPSVAHVTALPRPRAPARGDASAGGVEERRASRGRNDSRDVAGPRRACAPSCRARRAGIRPSTRCRADVDDDVEVAAAELGVDDGAPGSRGCRAAAVASTGTTPDVSRRTRTTDGVDRGRAEPARRRRRARRRRASTRCRRRSSTSRFAIPMKSATYSVAGCSKTSSGVPELLERAAPHDREPVAERERLASGRA